MPGAIVLGKPVLVIGEIRLSQKVALLLIDPAAPKSYCVVSFGVPGTCRAVMVSSSPLPPSRRPGLDPERVSQPGNSSGAFARSRPASGRLPLSHPTETSTRPPRLARSRMNITPELAQCPLPPWKAPCQFPSKRCDPGTPDKA